ncbi:MAG: N-acetyltransferase [Acidobacteriota bacterium]|nr:N-acetyltransferase [Acidobacteriota bacterium]
MTDFLIRPETDGDREGIARLLLAAFPTSWEARLVEQLRRDGDVMFSLVAVAASEVIGHALFSRLRAPDGALSLAPVAVAANRRRRGIAARMIEDGLVRARTEGWAAVVVLGDPSYYRRFGFSREAVRGMACRYAGPGLMGLALSGGGLEGPRIEHASAFLSIGDENCNTALG